VIRKIVLAAILFILSGTAANAVVNCSLSASGVAFGEVTKTGLTSIGAIVIRCTGTGSTNYVMALSTGLSNQYSPRKMPNTTITADPLPYNLYSEASLGRIWGNGAGASTLVTGTINMRNNLIVIVPLAVYGRVESRAEPAAGNYVDNINATMVLGGSPPANASFQVTAHVSKHCTVSATNLNFGSYTQAQLDGQSQIQLTCSDATPWDVGLNGGRFPGGTVARRSMSGPGGTQLDYQLFTDSARTVVWGDRVGTDTVSGTGNGIPQTLTVYGRIPAGERVKAGGYVDTITATLTF
jgi:spore coat protein U-like protein